ncbi:MAG TPA: hypothetical protein VKU80_06620, partial [Planctomycetota bacterium]|nr:hypothetical protein [Planctomycetota bacterium]
MNLPTFSSLPKFQKERRAEPGTEVCATAVLTVPFHCEGYSAKGKSRAINEDRFRFQRLAFPFGPRGEDALFLVVADGLGGEAAGEHASRIATDSLARYLS